MSDLKSRLLEHQAAFDALVELIPPKHYFAAADSDAQADGGKFAKNKRKRTQNKGELAKLAKRAKLDPEFKSSVLDIQQKQKNEAPVKASVSLPVSASASSSAPTGSASVVVPLNTSRPASIADLHARLQKKITELRNKRGVREESPAQKAKSKEEILEKRAKEKAAGKRKGKKGQGLSNGLDLAGGRSKDNLNKANGKPSAKPKAAPAAAGTTGDDFSFGKIEGAFGSQDSNNSNKAQKKKKDVNVLLKKAELREKKLAEKAQSNPEEAKADRERLAWAKAEKKALGVKSMDDVKLLKKSVKRTQAEKKKSAKEWAERQKTEKRSQFDAQKSRSDNITQRKENKKAKGEKGKPRGADAKKSDKRPPKEPKGGKEVGSKKQ